MGQHTDARGRVTHEEKMRRPRDLIGANWPTNPAVPLIKSHAVVSSFVSSLNIDH